jgi:hypothetical protein
MSDKYNDSTIDISELRLQEIGNQLGTPILSPTTKIQAADQSLSLSQNNADLQGMIDLQPSSKNPLLQYVVAGAIGLGAVGIPLTVLFGLGGTPTATKPKAPEIEDTTSSLADRELDNLKTQSALDIQAKVEPQTVAQAPKPVATPAPAAPKPAVAAQKPKPQPVVKAPAPAPKPVTIAVRPPTVTATPATIARPIPIPVARPRPISAPVIQQQLPIPIPVATQPTQTTPPEPPPLSFEQASALGMFGGDSDKFESDAMALESGDSSSVTLALPVGANVAAHTVTPYNSLSSRTSATNGTETPLSVQLDQPIQLSQGFSLPAGTIVQFGATVADNGAVTATSKGVFIDGTEIKVPVGAFALTASNSTALVANQRSLREGELSGADTTAAVWGAAGSLGKALVDSGNTSVVNSSGLGTSVVQTNSGRVNIPGALLNGAFSPLAKAKESRANALAQELQRSSKLNEIPVRSLVRVFVAAAATVQVPVTSDVTTANAGVPAQGGVLDGGNVERPPTMIPTKPLSAVDVQAPIAPLPTNNGAPTQPVVAEPLPTTVMTQPVIAPPPPKAFNTQPVVVPPSPTAFNTQPVVVPSPVTATTQPTTAPSTQATWTNPQFPIAPTKPNNVGGNQPTIVPISIGRVPSVVPQASNGVVAQPIATPNTISRSVITQPTFIPQQPIQQPATTIDPTAVSPLVTTPQSIQPTPTQSAFIPSQPRTAITTVSTPTQLPAATTQPVVLEQQPSTAPTQPATVPSQPTKAITTSPIAPTKPNNVVNIQPQLFPSQATGSNTTPALAPIQFNGGIDSQPMPTSAPTQLVEVQNIQDSAPEMTQINIDQSGLVPIQFGQGGDIQPATTQNPVSFP